MSKKLISALSAIAVLGLAACGDETVEEGDTTIVEADGMEPGASSVDSTVDTFPAEEDDGDSFSISEDGVDATINDGNTSINADLDDDPSVNVETD